MDVYLDVYLYLYVYVYVYSFVKCCIMQLSACFSTSTSVCFNVY